MQPHSKNTAHQNKQHKQHHTTHRIKQIRKQHDQTSQEKRSHRYNRLKQKTQRINTKPGKNLRKTYQKDHQDIGNDDIRFKDKVHIFLFNSQIYFFWVWEPRRERSILLSQVPYFFGAETMN